MPIEAIGSYFVIVLYVLATLALSCFGLHLYFLAILYYRRSRSVRLRQETTIEQFLKDTPPGQWPIVTSQIPIYNEAPVATRVIEAVARMNYPDGRHEIQVLDDSTDETRAIVDRTAARLRQEGLDVQVFRRKKREGFKAGALAEGLKHARGKHVAIFDADFVPTGDFLKRAVALLETDEGVACAQGRWTHLNRDESWLTQAAALGMDGHFGVEQGARSWNGFLMNFNGTAGVWRRAAIDDPRVGGWDGDTLTEDLDLSYRAQLAGWRIDYCVDLPCPAELPADVNALKAQQRRWAKGSIQVAVKLLPTVWRSGLSVFQKMEASLHLTHYLTAVGMVVLPIVALPLLFSEAFHHVSQWIGALWLVVFASAAAPGIVYTCARYNVGGGLSGLWNVPFLMALGTGLSLNNAVAAVQGLYQRGGVFVRTPKRGSTGDQVNRDYYRPPVSKLTWIELVLGLYSAEVTVVYLAAGRPFVAGFMLLYAIGYLSLGYLSLPRSDQRGLVDDQLETSLTGDNSPAIGVSGDAVGAVAAGRVGVFRSTTETGTS